MSGFARGVADAMLEGRVQSADSAAAFAAADAAHARSMLRDAQQHSDEMQARWRNYAKRLESVLMNRTAETSGALVVINAFLAALESEASPSQRERIRQIVVDKARARIRELDEIYKSDPTRASIAENFKNLPPNETIGVF